MPNERKQEIYAEECGFTCPCYPDDCPYELDGGCCGMTEPWFDCDNFIDAHWDAIQNAENRIALEERGE